MSNLEHYFENLLYHGEDVYDGINKQSLTSDVQDAVEVCAQYVIYSLFGNRKAFEKFINDTPAADVVERKKGKWIQRSDMPWYYYCSNCHRVISIASADQMEKFHAFCGTCGADMRENEDAVHR